MACQNQRSQHANRDHAWKQLRAKLYELEMSNDSRIKDLRTGVENSNTGAVLDGDLDKFIEASLKQGL